MISKVFHSGWEWSVYTSVLVASVGAWCAVTSYLTLPIPPFWLRCTRATLAGLIHWAISIGFRSQLFVVVQLYLQPIYLPDSFMIVDTG